MTAADPGAGAEPLPFRAARSYPIPFSDVWEAMLRSVAGLRGWEVLEKDPARGSMRLSTRSLLGYRPVQADLSLWLDDLGQTRLEIAFPGRARFFLPAAGPTRSRRVLNRLDRALQTRRRG